MKKMLPRYFQLQKKIEILRNNPWKIFSYMNNKSTYDYKGNRRGMLNSIQKYWIFPFWVLSVLFCSPLAYSKDHKERVQLWHQMIYSSRAVLKELIDEFHKKNPDIQVDLIYRETEELRSGFQAAALGGSGPEIIYGPSDQVGPFVSMKLIQPLENIFPKEFFEDFDNLSVIQFKNHVYLIGDMVGNHLMLLYNKKLISRPPQNTDDLLEIAKQNTIDSDGDGRMDRYGLVWNMSEPFFFVPWIFGFGDEVFLKEDGTPQLNTNANKNAFAFIRKLKEEKVVPRECDYEQANALFKEGKAAMIINGDWSWGDYKQANMDFGISRLPMVSSTGRWPAPLVGTKGYSVNINVSEQKMPYVIRVLTYLLSSDVQLQFSNKVGSLPSRLSSRKDPIVQNNPLLEISSDIMKVGYPMPVIPEIRAIWDTLRPHYQSVLAGSETPENAAVKSQENAIHQIDSMNAILSPGSSVYIVQLGLILFIFYIVFKIPSHFRSFIKEMKSSSTRFAHLMMFPAFVGLFLVVVYPFVYNLLLSFSNLSLQTFDDWKIIGFHHYIEVLKDPLFYSVLLKTIIWTGVNVFFHVFLGLFLALLINRSLPAKGILRTLLIIPWAVPQYITALTWRGMFNQEYGAINLMISKYLHMTPIQWLTDPFEAFSACILTNVWLGFPFMMVISLGGLQSISPQLYEAARVDGANAWQRFVHITWPMLKPVLLPAMTLGAIWTFNALNVVWLVSNSGEPADQTHILVSYVFKSAFNLYRYGYAAALSMIIFLILLVSSILFLRWKKATESMY